MHLNSKSKNISMSWLIIIAMFMLQTLLTVPPSNSIVTRIYKHQLSAKIKELLNIPRGWGNFLFSSQEHSNDFQYTLSDLAIQIRYKLHGHQTQHRHKTIEIDGLNTGVSLTSFKFLTHLYLRLETGYLFTLGIWGHKFYQPPKHW